MFFMPKYFLKNKITIKKIYNYDTINFSNEFSGNSINFLPIYSLSCKSLGVTDATFFFKKPLIMSINTPNIRFMFNRIKLPKSFLSVLPIIYTQMFFYYNFTYFVKYVKNFFSTFPTNFYFKFLQILRIFISLKSKNLCIVSVKIILKGKLWGQGDARKKKIVFGDQACYSNVLHSKRTVTFLTKSCFVPIFTNTGASSLLILIKHNH